MPKVYKETCTHPDEARIPVDLAACGIRRATILCTRCGLVEDEWIVYHPYDSRSKFPVDKG